MTPGTFGAGTLGSGTLGSDGTFGSDAARSGCCRRRRSLSSLSSAFLRSGWPGAFLLCSRSLSCLVFFFLLLAFFLERRRLVAGVLDAGVGRVGGGDAGLVRAEAGEAAAR